MTPHQEHRLRLLTERGTVAFTRKENLRKLAVECLELALVIEHHLEGKRGLEDIAYEGADVLVMGARANELPGVSKYRGHFEVIYRAPKDIHTVKCTAVQLARCVWSVLDGTLTEFALESALTDMSEQLNWLRTYVGADNWSGALDVKLSKAERYITDRELGRQPMSLLARPAGGLE